MRALVLLLLAASPAVGQETPARLGLGDCVATTIAGIGGRLQGDATFASGTSVSYGNGLRGISYDRVEPLIRSRKGDPIHLCLVEIPQGCPPGDDRGRVYVATNLRTGELWELPDSQHMCGGA